MHSADRQATSGQAVVDRVDAEGEHAVIDVPLGDGVNLGAELGESVGLGGYGQHGITATPVHFMFR